MFSPLKLNKDIFVILAALLQSRAYRFRMEQIQSDALRHGQSAAKNCARLQVQHFLSGLD